MEQPAAAHETVFVPPVNAADDGVAVPEGVGVAVPEGVGVAVEAGVGVAVDLGVGVAVALGVGVELPDGVTPPPPPHAASSAVPVKAKSTKTRGVMKVSLATD